MKTFLESIHFDPLIIDNLDQMDEETRSRMASLKTLYNLYIEKDLSYDIFIQSTKSLEARLLKNYKKTGKMAFIDHDIKWVDMVLEFRVFKLGALRFQYFPMDYVEIEREGMDAMPLSKDIKKRFYETCPLINVHIDTDTDLSEASVEASFNLAKDVFKKVYPDVQFKGFVTRTWLIHPGIVSLLDPNSNIAKFAAYFEIIASNDANYQALSRVYHTQDLSKIKMMEKKTRLEKNIYKNLDKLGVSFGFNPII